MPHRLVLPQKEISNEIAQLYKLRIGRGPMRVSTTIATNLVTCVLEATRTPQEATMLAAGARDLVRNSRTRFQLHVAADLVEIVERITGRTVHGHVAGYNDELDVAVETFLLLAEIDLSPQESGDAGRHASRPAAAPS